MLSNIISPVSQPISENDCKLYTSLTCIVRENTTIGPFIVEFLMWLPPPENMPLSGFKAFPASSQKTSVVEGNSAIIAVGIKGLDVFNYSSVTLFHLTSKTKLAVAEDSGYMGLS